MSETAASHSTAGRIHETVPDLAKHFPGHESDESFLFNAVPARDRPNFLLPAMEILFCVFAA